MILNKDAMQQSIITNKWKITMFFLEYFCWKDVLNLRSCLSNLHFIQNFISKILIQELNLATYWISSRSSRPEVFCQKGVLQNFSKFTGKYLCQTLFFNKVTGLRPATVLKKRLWHRCFPLNFEKILRTLFFVEHLRRRLLKVREMNETGFDIQVTFFRNQ